MGTLISGFDYELPDELIAQETPPERTDARLLVINRSAGSISHDSTFGDLPKFLKAGDVLVLNDTRVIPARIFGRKEKTGGKAELLLLKKISETRWEALAKPSRRLREGNVLIFGENLKAELVSSEGKGKWVVEFFYSGDFFDILDRIGLTPLPPYIRAQFEKKTLKERYQTVYAEKPGAAAAPTAGLHFTGKLLREIKKKGVSIAAVTVHTGLGTFRPVEVHTVEEHKMISEYYEINKEAAEAINNRPRGARVFAVGTTATRALETVSDDRGAVCESRGWTDIYIHPGYRFKSVDALITNFHQPRSTTLLLAAAFAGKALLLKAYKDAISEKYRFLSFGDATLIL